MINPAIGEDGAGPRLALRLAHVLVGGSAASLNVKDPNYANNAAAVAVKLG